MRTICTDCKNFLSQMNQQQKPCKHSLWENKENILSISNYMSSLTVNDNSIVEPIILDLKSCYAVKYNLCCTSDNNLFSSLLKLNALHTGFTMMDRQDTDEEFELIG